LKSDKPEERLVGNLAEVQRNGSKDEVNSQEDDEMFDWGLT